MTNEIQDRTFDRVYNNIKTVLEKARCNAYRAVNFAMVSAYWQIGKVIVEEEQEGKKKADYGKALITELSKKLTEEYGIGFTKSNLFYMRQFFLTFQNFHALRGELTWTHYRQLLRVEKESARQFYLQESINSNRSTRELERHINSLLYERIALSKDKEKVKELSEQGQIIKTPKDIIKEPYILEFLGLKDNTNLHESDIEQLLINKLKQFLLELGKGFSLVARQKRITVGGDHYYIDLVFYNYILKCFILIDLKLGKLTHQDIGQMDFYTRYYEKEEKQDSDNPTIGLILCSSKNESMVKYTLLDESKTIFASKYKLCLPTEEELKKEIMRERKQIEQEKNLAPQKTI